MFDINPISIVTALLFSPLAGLCAFFITFDEYTRHYPDNKMPFRLALEAGIYTFFFFFIIALVTGFIIARFI